LHKSVIAAQGICNQDEITLFFLIIDAIKGGCDILYWTGYCLMSKDRIIVLTRHLQI